MVIRRALLAPHEATTEGSRRLRELLRRQTFDAVARTLGCDLRTVRLWALEKAKPSRLLRTRVDESLKIPGDAWDDPPSESEAET